MSQPHPIEILPDEEWLLLTLALSQAEQVFSSPPPPPPPPPLPHTRPLSSKYRKGYLSVSDFTSLLWCEQYVKYETTLISHTKRETQAMTVGKEIHKALELELGASVEVDMRSREDG
ncbi:hypothetical protein HK097_004436, partial [Rhizophlyctis rosea]